jgi:hypothetical protein
LEYGRSEGCCVGWRTQFMGKILKSSWLIMNYMILVILYSSYLMVLAGKWSGFWFILVITKLRWHRGECCVPVWFCWSGMVHIFFAIHGWLVPQLAVISFKFQGRWSS